MPADQTRTPARWDNGLVAGIIYHPRGIEFCDLPARRREFKPFGYVGLLHEAEAQLDACYTRGDRSDGGPILIRHPRRFHRRHGD